MSRETADPATSIALATRNQGKIRELAALLEPFGLRVLGLDCWPELGEVEETGTTFAENAALKARAVSAATGLVAVADDSGLEVDALDNAPGVYSARYSAEPGRPATDERNVEKLLAVMAAVPGPQRACRFRCCMAAAGTNGRLLLAEGAWEGLLAAAPAGENGFGYDPIFLDPDLCLTAAEMSAAEKNSRSHRARAVAELLRLWPPFWHAHLESLSCRTGG